MYTEVMPRVYQQSRIWALCTFHWWSTLIFPKRITVDENGITTFDRRGVILFWLSDEERLSARQISSVQIKKGVLWDLVTIDTTGGTNVLQVHGLNKGQANALRNNIQALIEAQYQQPPQQQYQQPPQQQYQQPPQQ